MATIQVQQHPTNDLVHYLEIFTLFRLGNKEELEIRFLDWGALFWETGFKWLTNCKDKFHYRRYAVELFSNAPFTLTSNFVALFRWSSKNLMQKNGNFNRKRRKKKKKQKKKKKRFSESLFCTCSSRATGTGWVSEFPLTLRTLNARVSVSASRCRCFLLLKSLLTVSQTGAQCGG